ncbi:MAG: efflux RND transporter permease subunit [Saprospiraceae bacterium]|nr:efflux RND transporter permease subunit [Saprospiraceae bacterium]
MVIGSMVLLFGLPVFLLPNSIQNWEWYNKTLGNEWYVEHVKPTVNKVLGGTLRLFMWYVYEGSSYREADETALYVQASMPPGSTIEQLNTVFEQLENYLSNYKLEIKQFTTQINSGQNGQIEIYFNDGYNLAFPHQLKARLVSRSVNLGGIKWNIFGVGKGFSNDSGNSIPSFNVAMYGYNKEQLAKQAQRFANKLLAHPRIQEVNTEANINWWEKDIYEYALETNPLSMARQGVSNIKLLQVLNTFNQVTYPDYYLPNSEAVRLISDATSTNNLWILNNTTQQIDSLKFSFPTLAQLDKQKVSASIHKENQQYIRMVQFEYTGSSRFGQKYLDEVIAQMRKEMPLGYTIKEQNWSWGKEEQKQYALIGVGIALIFMICAIMFESFWQAFAILTLIPISCIGVFLTFYWFDFPFDQGGYTSFVLLSGNVVNSLILLVNDFNYYRKLQPNRSSLTLYLKAIYQKAIPIFLTIVSTILGLIPFFLHGETEVFWFSLAVGTTGGMIFSLFVIGLFLPVFFIRSTRSTNNSSTKAT